MSKTSSRWATKRAVASSKTRARLIFLLKANSRRTERVGVSESGLLVSPGEQLVLAALEFVGDERGKQVDRCHLLGLGLEQAGFEDIGHSREAQLAQRLVEFDEIHARSPVLRSTRSR